MKLTADDALKLGVIEKILPEQELGEKPFYDRLRSDLASELAELSRDPDLITKRYDRFRKIGQVKEHT